jgi:hypothetical protein
MTLASMILMTRRGRAQRLCLPKDIEAERQLLSKP